MSRRGGFVEVAVRPHEAVSGSRPGLRGRRGLWSGRRFRAETERNEAQRELVARRGSGDNTAELQQKLAEAEAKINHLTYLAAERHLGDRERNTLSIFLKLGDPNRHKIIIGSGTFSCPDCSGYADEFLDVFKTTTGWDPRRANFPDLNPAVKGVLVLVRDKENPPQWAIVVRDALNWADIPNGGIGIDFARF
jgi:hypothetical protein